VWVKIGIKGVFFLQLNKVRKRKKGMSKHNNSSNNNISSNSFDLEFKVVG